MTGISEFLPQFAQIMNPAINDIDSSQCSGYILILREDIEHLSRVFGLTKENVLALTICSKTDGCLFK